MLIFKNIFTTVDDKHTCCNPFPDGTFTCLESAQIDTLARFTSISSILKHGAIIIIINAYSLKDVNIQFYQVIWHLIANYCILLGSLFYSCLFIVKVFISRPVRYPP